MMAAKRPGENAARRRRTRRRSDTRLTRTLIDETISHPVAHVHSVGCGSALKASQSQCQVRPWSTMKAKAFCHSHHLRQISMMSLEMSQSHQFTVISRCIAMAASLYATCSHVVRGPRWPCYAACPFLCHDGQIHLQAASLSQTLVAICQIRYRFETETWTTACESDTDFGWSSSRAPAQILQQAPYSSE